MTADGAGRYRLLLIRSYFALAGALVLAALLLDFAFARLESREAQRVDPWFESTFRAVEARLASVTHDARPAAARAIGVELGVDIQLLDGDDVSTAQPAAGSTQVLTDDGGRSWFLRESSRLGGLLRFGPIAPPPRSRIAELLPPLFYLSVLVIVGFWLRPLFRDLQLLTSAAQRFAVDYREPLRTATRTTRLRGLARNLDDMSMRLSQLIQSQKELTAALSHEMRTPLARIRFALAVAGNDLPPAVQGQLRDVNADVEQIDALIATMLDYARLDHPELRTDVQDVPLEPWLRHTLAASASRTVSVDVRGEPGVDTLRMDPRLMELAVSNLISNAARHARERVVLTLEAIGSEQRIAVDDDGPGIPDSQRDVVFKAFTRLDTSRNRETGGFGLGLAIVARVAALHGGKAHADVSASLGGARFVITWPRG